jgi:hypothetical protein
MLKHPCQAWFNKYLRTAGKIDYVMIIKLFTDLNKLKLVKLGFKWWFSFRIELIFTTVLSASKNEAHFKSGQK